MTAPVTPNCPQCGKRLERVERGPNSMLNADQFDAIRAGDWVCNTCPPDGRSHTSARYFWDHELTQPEPVTTPVTYTRVFHDG